MHRSALTRLPMVALGIAIASTTGCAAIQPSEIDPACDALRPYLPTYSTADTLQTRQEGVRFHDVFKAVCE